jgi:hypothetical protein
MLTNLNQNGMGEIKSPNAPFLKDSSLSEKELNDLREKFKQEYAKLKGWNPSNLNAEQLNEIHSDKRWQSPLLLS